MLSCLEQFLEDETSAAAGCLWGRSVRLRGLLWRRVVEQGLLTPTIATLVMRLDEVDMVCFKVSCLMEFFLLALRRGLLSRNKNGGLCTTLIWSPPALRHENSSIAVCKFSHPSFSPSFKGWWL